MEMETVSPTLEKYLRLLSEIVQLQWRTPNPADDNEDDPLYDRASEAWLEMSHIEHGITDMYVALHYAPLHDGKGGYSRQPPEYSHEQALEAGRFFLPRLHDYLCLATRALQARWADQLAEAEGKVGGKEEELYDEQYRLWDAMDEHEQRIASAYTGRYFAACMDKDGRLFKEVPHYITARELICRTTVGF